MEKQEFISEEVYTNSLLISPNPNDSSIKEFSWLRRNSYFCSAKERPIITDELFYQCTILDYLSTIQLVILEKNGQKTRYIFGPIQLQTQLFSFLKVKAQSFNVKVIFSKRPPIDALLTIKSENGKINLNFELQNQVSFNLLLPDSDQEEDYESIFKTEQGQLNELNINFLKEKRFIVEILKKLKIFSYQGNRLKLQFKDQFQRQLFILSVVLQAGFSISTEKFKPIHQFKASEIKTQQSRSKDRQSNLQHVYFGQYHLNNGTSSVRLNNKFNISLKKNESQENCEENRRQNSENLQQKNSNVGQFKKSDFSGVTPSEINKAFCEKKKHFLHQKAKLEEMIKQTKQLEKNNKRLEVENAQLKLKMESMIRINTEPKKSENIPEFMKIIQINKKILNKAREQNIFPKEDEQQRRFSATKTAKKRVSHLPKTPQQMRSAKSPQERTRNLSFLQKNRKRRQSTLQQTSLKRN